MEVLGWQPVTAVDEGLLLTARYFHAKRFGSAAPSAATAVAEPANAAFSRT
jgi:UDP-glucuronate decarboxylase